MPKVLYLITELDIGGAEKNLFRLARGLKSRGWAVEVATLSGRGEVGEWLAKEGIQVHYVDMDFKANPFAFARLVRTMRGVKPDVLHTFLFHANVAGRLANLFARVPVVVSSIRVAERRRPSHLWMDGFTQALMDAEVCVSDGVRDFARRRARIRAGKLRVIGNPVEPIEASRPRAQVRAELGVGDTDLVVLSVGRLDVQKGYIHLVQAASGALRSRADLFFVIVGEGGSRREIEDAARMASITDRFRLLGWRSDVNDFYCAADMFVLPSLWEGMSNALLEAAAAGLPLIATSVEGSREIIDDMVTGMLVPPANAQALEAAILRLACDAQLRRQFGADAHSRVLAEHSVSAFVDAHVKLYLSLSAAAMNFSN